MKNICDDCGWIVSDYQYSYDEKGFITGETALESLYIYAFDDKHQGKHENGWHDSLYLMAHSIGRSMEKMQIQDSRS